MTKEGELEEKKYWNGDRTVPQIVIDRDKSDNNRSGAILADVDERRSDIKKRVEGYENENPKLVKMVKETVAMIEIVDRRLDRSTEEARRFAEAHRKAQTETIELVESLVWDAIDSLKDEHIFSELVDKMAYIEGKSDNAEAQLRGLMFEAISHEIQPGDARIIVTVGPETTDNDTPDNRNRTMWAVVGTHTVPLENFKVMSADIKSVKLEKSTIVGESVKADLKSVLEDERIKGVATVVDASDIRDLNTPLPENAVYVYLPNSDKDTHWKLRDTCISRGVPYYSYDNKLGWHVTLPNKWYDNFEKTPAGEKAKVDRAKELLALEYFVRRKNEQHNNENTVPDGVLINEDNFPVGVVETKCWYPDEIARAIELTRETKGITSNDVLIQNRSRMTGDELLEERSHMTLDEAIAVEAQKNREENQNKLSPDQRAKIQSMNLFVKIAEELRFMENAGVRIKGPKVLLRFPADINSGEAQELVQAMAEKNIDVYVQILPITADQTGRLALELLRSEMMVKKLEQRYEDKKREQSRDGMLKALKARCLALKLSYVDLSKMEDSPEPDNETITKLWKQVRGQTKQKSTPLGVLRN